MAQNIANRGFSDKSHYNDLSAPETNVRAVWVVCSWLQWFAERKMPGDAKKITIPRRIVLWIPIVPWKKPEDVKLIGLSEGHQKTWLLIGRTKQIEGRVKRGWPAFCF